MERGNEGRAKTWGVGGDGKKGEEEESMGMVMRRKKMARRVSKAPQSSTGGVSEHLHPSTHCTVEVLQWRKKETRGCKAAAAKRRQERCGEVDVVMVMM